MTLHFGVAASATASMVRTLIEGLAFCSVEFVRCFDDVTLLISTSRLLLNFVASQNLLRHLLGSLQKFLLHLHSVLLFKDDVLLVLWQVVDLNPDVEEDHLADEH